MCIRDSHSMPSQLPEAYAIVHPEHPGADYPFKYLAGCGVAFKIATALLETIPTAVSYTHLDVYKRQGLTLYEMAELMKSYGVMTGYNLDVGDSSTMYSNG